MNECDWAQLGRGSEPAGRADAAAGQVAGGAVCRRKESLVIAVRVAGLMDASADRCVVETRRGSEADAFPLSQDNVTQHEDL
jgi:hypothetical protein